MNPYVDSAAGSVSGDGGGSEGETSAGAGVSYAAVAARLLQDNFLLTALELHTELVESGRELPQLREFFSNPGNFEQHVSRPDPGMQRTPSQATLDSLDLARYSEEGGCGAASAGGGGGGDLAVLEFELRKAKETINSLRANLTQFADCESSDNARERLDGGSLKPHEKRALNFLVNEYLLLQHYKLTSITFSDENPDQDFEDWDDVGLNVPRPCGLISLYRGEPASVAALSKDTGTCTEILTVNADCQTDVLDEESMCVSCQTSFDGETDWNNEILILAEEIVLLKRQVLALETEKLNFQKLYDAALASLNSLTTPVSDSTSVDLAIPQERMLAMRQGTSLERICEQPLTYTATENHYGSDASTNSVTPEQFEMIDCEKNGGSLQKEGSNASWYESARAGVERGGGGGGGGTPDDSLSLNEGGEWTRLHHADTASVAGDTWMESGLPEELKARLLGWCCEAAPAGPRAAGHDLVTELLAADAPPTPQAFIALAADTLLRIVPHTLVGRRCEAAALLAATVHLLVAAAPDSPRRARLLQLLLTLLKQPEAAETRVITDAACAIVKWGGGGEVLSCAAELLASRSAERRALAGRVCVAVAPHAPRELCASLLLSLAQLMCEAAEPEVRRLGLRACALVCPLALRQYGRLEGALIAALRDPDAAVRGGGVAVFAPVLAWSALGAGKFSSELFHRVMSQLVRLSNESDWKNVIVYLDIVKALVPPTLAYVMNVQIVSEYKNKELDKCHQEIHIECKDFFLSLNCYMFDCATEPRLLINAMNKIFQETPDVRWPELSWFLDKIFKELIEIAMSSKTLNHPSIYTAFINVFSAYCEWFGRNFTTILLKSIFCDIICDIEQRLEKLQQVNTDSTVVAGIFLAAVLPCSENCEEEVTVFLERWMVCCGVCGLPVAVLAEPLKWLVGHRPALLTRCLQRMGEMVASSGESRKGAAVRALAADLLAELVTCPDLAAVCLDAHVLPVIVSLVHDDDAGVRERGVVALGGAARAAARSERCWAALEEAARGASGAGEAARAADALASLLAPELEADADLPMKVLSLLCDLCQRAPLTSDALSSLLPGLQLAVHFAQPDAAFVQATLLPALRRLEKVESPALAQHRQAAEALAASVAPAAADAARPHAPAALLAAPDTVSRRVTQIFNTSKSNIPNLFKKKS